MWQGTGARYWYKVNQYCLGGGGVEHTKARAVIQDGKVWQECDGADMVQTWERRVRR